MLKCLNGNKGTTLVEMLVVIVIIAILSLIVLANYKSGGSQLALQRSAGKLSQDIRRAEEMAISAQQCTTACGGVAPYGYGIYLAAGATTYLLYADTYPLLVGNENYDSQDVVIETISFEKGVRLKSTNPATSSINFRPPDPTVKITNSGVSVNEATTTLELQTDPSKTKIIYVNKAGLIYVQ